MAGGVRKLFVDEQGLRAYAIEVVDNKHLESTQENVQAECMRIKTELKRAVSKKDIRSISIRGNGTMVIRTNDLFISTRETGVLRKFAIGSWEITMRLGYEPYFKANDLKYAFDSGCWGANTVHPHVSGRTHHGCLGNTEGNIYKSHQRGDIVVLISLLIGYLTSVNVVDGAGKYLSRCVEVELDDEGNPILVEDGPGVFNYKWKEANEFIQTNKERNYRSSVTTNYSNPVDLEHHEYLLHEYDRKCEMCSTVMNSWHLTKLNNSYVCSKCKDNVKVCDICGGMWFKSTGLANDEGTLFCKDCAYTYEYKCNYCNNYILPNGTPEEVKNKIADMYKSPKSSAGLVLTPVEAGYTNIPTCKECRKALFDAPTGSALAKKVATLHKHSDVISYIRVVDTVNITDVVAIKEEDIPAYFKYPISDLYCLPSTNQRLMRTFTNHSLKHIANDVSIFGGSTDMKTKHLFGVTNLIGILRVDRGSRPKYIEVDITYTVIPKSYIKQQLMIIPKSLLAKPWEDINVVDNNYIMSFHNEKGNLEVEVAKLTEERQRELAIAALSKDRIFI